MKKETVIDLWEWFFFFIILGIIINGVCFDASRETISLMYGGALLGEGALGLIIMLCYKIKLFSAIGFWSLLDILFGCLMLFVL